MKPPIRSPNLAHLETAFHLIRSIVCLTESHSCCLRFLKEHSQVLVGAFSAASAIFVIEAAAGITASAHYDGWLNTFQRISLNENGKVLTGSSLAVKMSLRRRVFIIGKSDQGQVTQRSKSFHVLKACAAIKLRML
ncbi:hypothetical protein RRG08_035119 [Elysia crispata]|uniref:Uncharacterized protein n=1 Tax=Elysia crispata TaxID=231223 RepID=A0AAE1A7N6_9GAST|nr:hypothetical protein RRG08_035119 [Elysia crispata]